MQRAARTGGVDEQTLAEIAWAYQRERVRMSARWQRAPVTETLTDSVLAAWLL